MSYFEGREESPMPTGPSIGTLGTLTLVKRKGGTDVQTFPLDAERITFGRDYDCDVRLYYSDVSKLHCEIRFDLITGQASLHVHGSNGLLHTPEGGSASSHKPPSIIPLSNKDTITIRKKPFRFEYGSSETTDAAIMSPAVHRSSLHDYAPSPAKQMSPAPGSPAGPSVRRRASHRLSLVPSGKTFVPLSPAKNRRHSTLGLGGMGVTAKMGGGKSKLSEEIHEEQSEIDQEEEAEQSVVDVTDGDEGDVVYLEVTDEPKEVADAIATPSTIHNNPFMTPQQTRKAPLRNTSAVPRTRKMNAPATTGISEGQQVEDPSASIDDAIAMPESPKTPRSVPLPPTSDTPYNPPATSSQKLPTTPIPAHVALATPKGPATLRKALLLRSARKVWQETRAAGVEGAIQNGEIEVRRKSTSPKIRAGRKSATPVPVLDPASDSSEEEEAEPASQQDDHAESGGEPVEEGQVEGQLQWISEDGTAEVSFESESSGMDSLDADMSLDIPGQSVLHLTPAGLEEEEEYINNHVEGEMDEDEEEEQYEEYEEYEEEVKVLDDEEEMQQEEEMRQDDGMEQDEEEDDMATSLPGTPVHRPIATNKFFTPQPQRGNLKQPRRSLANIGGPAVRFERLPATPGSLRGVRAAPGSMGKPSRRVNVTLPDDNEEKADVKRAVPMVTPRKTYAMLAEDQRLQEALATPRTLPAPPATGFKSPVRETRFADLVATPTHPALAPKSPEPEQGEQQTVPSTPMGDIKKRLDSIRRQSVQRQATLPVDRRATIGFAGTPVSKPVFIQSASYSVAANSRRLAAHAPRTPIFPPFKRETAETPIHFTPLPGTSAPDNSHEAQEVTPKAQPPSSPEAELPSSPSTPSYTGLREMLKPVMQAKTPYLTGIRNLFPVTPQESASPSLTGVRALFAEPTVPATPSFAGLKTMFARPTVPPTPALEGLREMFEEEEEEEEEEEIEVQTAIIPVEVEEADEEVEPIAPTKKTGKVDASKLPRLASSTSSSSTARSNKATSAASAASVSQAAKAPVKRGRSTSKAVQEEAALAPKVVRSRKIAALAATVEASTAAPTSRSTRAHRTASVDPESSTSRSRSTRAKSTAEPEEQASAHQEEGAGAAATKTTRNRSTSSRAKKAVVTESPIVEEEDKPKPARGKKVLTQIDEQPTVESATEEKKSAPSRGKKATTSASTSAAATKQALSTSAKSAPARSRIPSATSKSVVGESKSAPVRRGKGKATEEKENDESQVVVEDSKTVSAPVKRRGVGVKKEESAVPVAVGRTTRSRK
ncbi:hypothetical protein CI109_106824 [Kwoniella shandongensis]|uniref:FHA domain-containing protein n=1 Tax=Kwoniella shandongensis TaxID=1734106 RepID=A0AAJ8LMX9_9TREE